MTLYLYLTAALLIYPMLAYLVFHLTRNRPVLRKHIIHVVAALAFIIITAMLAGIITIWQNLNWFLFTFLYLPLLLLLRLCLYQPQKFVRGIGNTLLLLFTFCGLILATIGFFFLWALSFEQTAEIRWAAPNLVYAERKIGWGWDPDERITKVEVYKTIPFVPVLAVRIIAKTYDDWDEPKQKPLDIALSKDKKTMILKSHVEGYKVWDWSDTLYLSN